MNKKDTHHTPLHSYDEQPLTNALTNTVTPFLSHLGGKPESTGELKLINQGTYGCIFHPGINCQGKKENAKYLTKIQKNAKTIENEYAVSKIIKTIKGYTKYFAPIVKQCPVKIAKQYTNELQQCELFHNVDTRDLHKQTYVSNKIRYVGNNNLSDHIQAQTTQFQFWKEMLETHAYLLKGVDKLLTKNLVHYDIKYNNIMIDPQMKKPVFIDFGITVPIDNLTDANARDYFYVFDTYPYWCFEVCVCNFIFRDLGVDRAKSTTVDAKTLHHIYNVFVYGEEHAKDTDPEIDNSVFSSALFKQNTNKIVDEYRKTVLEYYAPFIGTLSWFDLYKHYMEKEYYKTWDTYSLAVVYLFLIETTQKQNPKLYQQLEHSASKPVFTKYMAFLFTAIFNRPDHRPTPDVAIKTIRQLMKLAETVL